MTHDQEEAFALADRLVMLHDGRVEQVGTPAEVYARPASAWTARFLGFNNLIAGSVVSLEPFSVKTPLGVFQVGEQPDPPGAVGQPVTLPICPGGLKLEKDSLPGRIKGTVEDVLFQGDQFRIGLRCAEGVTLQISLVEPFTLGKPWPWRSSRAALVCLE